MRVRAIAVGRLVALVTLACLWSASGVQAAIVLDTPTGLADGQAFRFIFVTSTTTPASSDTAATYDLFVDNLAADTVNLGASALTYGGGDIDWFALVSTADRVASTFIPSNVPVYLLNGDLVAATGNLWSGSLESGSGGIHMNQLLANQTGQVWTGTSPTGGSASPLGGSLATYGLAGQTDGRWMQDVGAGNPDNSSLSRRIYGISEILYAPISAVPEPTSLAMLVMAGVGVLGRRSLRRRKAG